MRKPLSAVHLKRILKLLPTLSHADFTTLIQAMNIEVQLRGMVGAKRVAKPSPPDADVLQSST